MLGETTELPHSLALVDDDPLFSEALMECLRGQGITADWFADSESLLHGEQPYNYDFYVLDLGLPGLDGLGLLKQLRKGSQAGVLVVSGRMAQEVFGDVVKAGADMFIGKPASLEQLQLAVTAVYRRSGRRAWSVDTWRLDLASALLIAPDSTPITLSATDCRVLEHLLLAEAHTATRAELSALIGLSDNDPNLLNATLYRLRRRIEAATGKVAPLQSRARLGYQFRASLVRA